MKYQVVKNVLGQVSVKYHCPGCKTKLRSPLAEAGQPDSCPDCRVSYIVPAKEERIKFERLQKQAEAAAAEAKEKQRAEQEAIRKQKEAEKLASKRAVSRRNDEDEELRSGGPQTPPPANMSPYATPSFPLPPNMEPPMHERPMLSAARQILVCPYCQGELVPGVQKCRHCGEFLVGTGHSDAMAGCLGFMLGPVGLWYKGHFGAGFAWLAFIILISVATGGLAILLAPLFWIAMGIHAASVPGKR